MKRKMLRRHIDRKNYQVSTCRNYRNNQSETCKAELLPTGEQRILLTIIREGGNDHHHDVSRNESKKR